MDISGLNPTIISDQPVFPQDWTELSQKAKDCYNELDKEYHDENPGVYFRANIWAWRPIHLAIIMANELHHLGISPDILDGMGYNSGHGLATQEECDGLAEALADMVENMREKNVTKFGFNMGSWVDRGDVRKEISEEEITALNLLYPRGELITKFPVEFKDDDKAMRKIYPSHVVSVDHVEEFILFLSNCGGFEIY
jgi:hypothetical protein